MTENALACKVGYMYQALEEKADVRGQIEMYKRQGLIGLRFNGSSRFWFLRRINLKNNKLQLESLLTHSLLRQIPSKS